LNAIFCKIVVHDERFKHKISKFLKCNLLKIKTFIGSKHKYQICSSCLGDLNVYGIVTKEIHNKKMSNSHMYIAMFPGCGNGRYLDINPPVFKLGMDVCCPLIDHAREKGTTPKHSPYWCHKTKYFMMHLLETLL